MISNSTAIPCLVMKLTSEFVPAAQADSRALLVVLHGLGDSLDGWRWLPRELGLPWMNYLLVNAPKDYWGGYSWFDLVVPRFPEEELVMSREDVGESRARLHALLDERRASGWPSDQTAILGFSQGCLIAVDAGLRYPHRLAALVGISGWIHEPGQLAAERSETARLVPVLITHGTDDPLVPIQRAELGVRRLQAAGFDVAWQVFEKAHTVAGEAEVGFIRRFLEGAFQRTPHRRPSRGASPE